MSPYISIPLTTLGAIVALGVIIGLSTVTLWIYSSFRRGIIGSIIPLSLATAASTYLITSLPHLNLLEQLKFIVAIHGMAAIIVGLLYWIGWEIRLARWESRHPEYSDYYLE